MSTFLIVILLLTMVIIALLFLPMSRRMERRVNKSTRIDERDTMFSRRELIPGSDKYNHYYSAKPEVEELDKGWRSRPGLLSPDSQYNNPLAFAAAEASFHTIGNLTPMRFGKPSAAKTSISADAATNFLRNMLLKAGALDVGFTLMAPYHYYSVGGRKERYGQEITPDHKYGIAILVEMDQEMTGSAPAAPIVMESASRYLTSGVLAVHCAETIRNLGFEAIAHIDGNYSVVCPLVAADAGLGEIGRMGLLMHPDYGPRVRIAVVTTDIPLIPTESHKGDSVLYFCTICEKCADTCPGRSIPKGAREDVNGSLRWQIDQESCFTFWCTAGTDCGRCMSVCPYSHGRGLFHDFVRWGIRNNWIFAFLALKLDDIFYGRKPTPAKLPNWLTRQKPND